MATAERGSPALVVAMAYIIQVQSAAWHVKFTDSIHGAAPGRVIPGAVDGSTAR